MPRFAVDPSPRKVVELKEKNQSRMACQYVGRFTETITALEIWGSGTGIDGPTVSFGALGARGTSVKGGYYLALDDFEKFCSAGLQYVLDRRTFEATRGPK